MKNNLIIKIVLFILSTITLVFIGVLGINTIANDKEIFWVNN